MVAIAAAILIGCKAAADDSPRILPDYSLMLNEDGDVIFVHSIDTDPAQIEIKLRQNLDSLLDTPIKTLVFNVACGSDVMHYPTRVGSQWGWRRVKKEEAKPWSIYLPGLRAATRAGLDGVRIAAEWARDNDLFFVPSYRINDSHYAHEPEHNPLTGRFYLENTHLELGVSPVPGDTSFARLLNFEHPEVREYRLNVIREVIDRYGDVMDGLQIDFMRQPVLFPAGRGKAGAALITQFISHVREALSEAEARHGRTLPLMVRVPPTLRNCAWAGLEVEHWMQAGLVDIVIPSAGMTLNHDVPYGRFEAMADGTGVEIGAAVFPRTQFTWPPVREPDLATYSGAGSREVTPAQLRGAVNNARAAGVDIIEFYNVDLPLNEYGRSLVLAAAESMRGERIYAVTPAYYLDSTDTYEPRKQVPLVLEAGEQAAVNLAIGEQPHSTNVKMALLRLGLRGVGDTSRGLLVRLNESTIFDGPLDNGMYIPVTGKRSRPSRLHPPDPQAYLHIRLPDLSMMRLGNNQLELTFVAEDDRALFEIVEAQLFFYSQK